jgi:molecular chaperone GrpE
MDKKKGKQEKIEIEDEIVVGEIVDEEVCEEQSELEALAELSALYMNKIKQQAAEFENYRNRTAKEMGQMFDKGVRDTILALLPVVDNFARALKNENVDEQDGFAAGMRMIQNQLISAMESLGVTKIDAVGQEFDIKYHAAVSHIQDENLGKNVVAEELQTGYIYKDNVIRHAMVVVAN